MLGMIGALLLVLSGASAGEAAARSLIITERRLADLVSLLEKTSIYLSSELLGTEEIFERLSSCENSYSGFFMTDDPVSALRASSYEMSSRFADYLENFGHTDLAGQLAQNALFLGEVRDSHCTALERRTRLCKLCRLMGVSAGLMAAIIFF